MPTPLEGRLFTDDVQLWLERWWASAMVALVATLAMGVGSLAADEDEVKKTWDAAEVAVYVGKTLSVFGRMDDPKVQAGLAALPQGQPFPTIIYLHGCDGLYRNNYFVFRDLPKEGYAVIAPDSFARTGRMATCGSPTGSRGTRPLRKEEIQYAARQARNLPWVDSKNLFLFGQSEGGGAAIRYSGDEFNARVASGAGCWRVRRSTPLLVVNFRNDAYMGSEDNCTGNVDRVFRVSGKGHWPWRRMDAQSVLLDFLAQHSSKDDYGENSKVLVGPQVVARSKDEISLRRTNSDSDVYDTAKAHCETFGKASNLINRDGFGVYYFSCD
jgi:hypothetical protein